MEPLFVNLSKSQTSKSFSQQNKPMTYSEFEQKFGRMYRGDKIFQLHVDKLYQLVLQRRNEDKSKVVQRYNRILDELNEQDYPFKYSFNKHRIKVDESDMIESGISSKAFKNNALALKLNYLPGAGG